MVGIAALPGSSGDRLATWLCSGWRLVAGAGAVLSLVELIVAVLPISSVIVAAGARISLATIVAASLLAVASRNRRGRNPTTAASPPPLAVAVPDQVAPPASSVADTAGLASCVTRAVGYFSNISTILKDETERVIVATEQNGVSLMEELRNVETSMEELLNFINAASSSDRIVQIIERTETQLARSQSLIADFSSERIRAAGSAQLAMHDIGAVVGDLGRMVQMVRALSRQTRMLAFNASIEAARAGPAGLGFAVVASEVKNLSLQSDQAAVQIGADIAKLEQVVQASLNTIIGERIAKEATGFDDISAAVSELTDNLQNLFSHQRDTLKKVQYENERLSDPIMQMIGSIQFQDVLKQRLRAIESCFDNIAEAVENSTRDISRVGHISLAQMDDIMRTRLGEMIRFATKEVQAKNQVGAGVRTVEPQGAAMEMF